MSASCKDGRPRRGAASKQNDRKEGVTLMLSPGEFVNFYAQVGAKKTANSAARLGLSALLAGFFIIALLRVFSAPLKLAVKLLVNTLLGFLALWAVNVTAGVTGIALGVNVFNALVIGVLGLPGFVLLLLVQWVI